MKPDILKAACEATLGEALDWATITPQGQVYLRVKSSALIAVMQALKTGRGLQFDMLMDVAGIDYLHYGHSEWECEKGKHQGYSRAREPLEIPLFEPNEKHPARFAVVYQLLSISLNQRLTLEAFISETKPIVPSLVSVFPSANWYEREAFDLFGILFEGHPDLRRLLTDYHFEGHPFRKDFPLSGELEVRYDETQGRVIYEPVSIEPRVLVPKTIRPLADEETGALT